MSGERMMMDEGMMDEGMMDDAETEEFEEDSYTEEAPYMTDDQLAGLCQQELSNATGGSKDDEIDSSRINALKYYFGRNRGDEVPGRSRIQSLDVADMVDAILSQVTPIFANDTMVQFDAENAEDEDQAQLESDFVNHVIMDQNNGYTLFYQAFQDALLLRNCVIKVSMGDKIHVTTNEYEGITPMELQQLLQPTDENTDISVESMSESEVSGVDVTIKTIKHKQKLLCEPVPLYEFRYNSDLRSTHLQDAVFTSHVTPVLRSDLVAMGYDQDLVMELASEQGAYQQENLVRDRSASESDYESTHKMTDRIMVAECYYRVDFDGDGIAELRKVVLGGVAGEYGSGGVVLENVPVEFHPFAAGTAFILAHRFLGISIYDKLKDVQDAKTSILRQMLDNQNTNNNPKTEVDIKNLVNPDDVLTSKPAQLIRSKKMGSINQLPINDIGPSCVGALNYMDTVRTNRAGAALDMQSQGAAVAGDTAHGVERVATAREQLSAMMSRTVGETIIHDLYLLVHETIRTQYPGEMTAKIGNSWQNSNPREWLPRQSLTVTVGMSMGERMRQKAALSEIMQQQKMLIDAGQLGVAVTAEQAYHTLTDFVRAAGQNNPERYWTDPSSPESQQQAQKNAEKAEQKQQEQKQMQDTALQAQSQIAQAELEKANVARGKVQMQGVIDGLKQELAQIQAQSDALSSDADLQFKYDEMFNKYALQLTQIEADITQQQNQNYLENRNAISLN